MPEQDRAGKLKNRATALPREEVHPAALKVIERYGSAMLRTARRYSRTAEDAEDAYQRALEILLTKAPTTRLSELVPWLKTVVKHEAFAVRRQNDSNGRPAEEEVSEDTSDTETAEQVERYELLRLGAEAMRRLKPQEVRCLLLRAEGYSYQQICQETGWTYTKVNRCLTEGRQSFARQVAGIESGAECERLAPLLSSLADREASDQDIAALRPHLRRCLTCRAKLREWVSVPARVAALVPPVGLLSDFDAIHLTSRGLESLVSWLHDRATALGLKLQGTVEVASAQKVTAVAASTAAIGGGAAAVGSVIPERDPPPRKPPLRATDPRASQQERARPFRAASVPASREPRRRAPRERSAPHGSGASVRRSQSRPSPVRASSPSNEFGTPSQSPSSSSSGNEFESAAEHAMPGEAQTSRLGSPSSGSGGGEFDGP